MTELELQQVKCPSCKRVISSFSPFQAEVECPYCHNKAFNPLITSKIVPLPERIIKLSLTENEFENNIIKHLVDTKHVPVDIFDHLTTDKILKAYLPMYLFEGIFEVTVTSKTEDISTNQPVTKSIKHNFSFMSLAYEGDEIPPELSDFARWIDYNPFQSVEFDPVLLGLTGGPDDPTTLAINADKITIWNEFAKKSLTNHIADQGAGHAKQEIRSITLHSSRYVLVPIWFVYYNYNSEKYCFIMDGSGEKEFFTYPVNQKEKKYVSRMETWGCVLAFLCSGVCLFIKTGNFFTWLFLVIASFFVIFFAFWIPCEIRCNKSRKMRRMGAQRLLGESNDPDLA